MRKTTRYAASLALGVAMSMSITPAAQAIIRAPLAQADDQMSRNVAFLDGGQCTGTLIDKDWVVTAKHCIDYPGGMGGAIKPGSTVDIGPDMGNFERRTVAQTHVFPDPDPKAVVKYDLALLKLDKPSTITPAKVYDGTSPVSDGSRTRSYGFGTPVSYRNSSGKSVSAYNKKISFQTGKITNPSQIPDKDRLDFMEAPPGHIIYSKLDGTSRTVPGDSGGPLFLADGRLYGVLFGSLRNYEDMERHSNSMYSPLYVGMDWIEKTTGVDFTNKERNISIQKKIDSDPYKFKTPTKDDYANTVEDETTGLKIQTYLNLLDNQPELTKGLEDPRKLPYPDPNGKKRDPSPTDSDIRAGDDKIPTGENPKPTSTSKDKPTTTKEEPKPSTPKDKPTTTSKEEPKPSTPKDKPTSTSKEEPKPSTPKDKPTSTSKEEPKPSTPKDKPTSTSKEDPKPTSSSEDTKPSTGKDVEPSTSPEDTKTSSEPTNSTSGVEETTSTETTQDSASATLPEDVATTSTSKSAPTTDGDSMEPTSTSDSTSKNKPTTSSSETETSETETSETSTVESPSTTDSQDLEDKIKDATGIGSKNADMDADAKKERDNKMKNSQVSGPSKIDKIHDATGLGSPSAVMSSSPVAGPVVDTGGEVEKEGLFAKIKHFLFG